MKHLNYLFSVLTVALFAAFGSMMILGGIDTAMAMSEAPTHLVQYVPHFTLAATYISLSGILPASSLLSSPIVSGLTTYAGKYQKELIGQVFNNLDIANLNVVTNVKGKTYFPALSVGRGLKKYGPTFGPVDDLTFTDRALTPELAKRELQVEPKKFLNTFMSEQMSMKATNTSIPFENFIMQKLMEQVAGELNDYVIGAGDTADADPAKAITNGFLKIITADLAASAYTVTATGAWSNTNAHTKAETLFKALPTAWKTKDTNMYLSYTQFFNYLEAYRAAYPYDISVYQDATKPLYVKHSNGKCKLVPSTWLGSSNRVIIAPKENMVVGTDSLDDRNAIKAVEDVWIVKMGLSFLIGMCIPDPTAIWVNDQA